MAKKIKLNVVVGRQRNGAYVQPFEAEYISSIRGQVKSIIQNYERIVNGFKEASPQILYDALKPTFALSQKYVPVLTGDLKRSGFLEQENRPNNPRVVIGYGKGGFPNYAAFVHEKVEIPHRAPTRAKYLLSALEEDQNNIQRRIVRGYKELMGGR